MALDLMVFCWTMGDIKPEYTQAVSGRWAMAPAGRLPRRAVRRFPRDTQWQFITGGQWVSHPGGDGVRYTVNICHGSSPLVEGLRILR